MSNFYATKLTVDGDYVGLVGPSGAQVRRLSNGAVVATLPDSGAFAMSHIAICDSGNSVHVAIGRIVTPGNPAQHGITFANTANGLQNGTGVLLGTSAVRGLVCAGGKFFAAFPSATGRGMLRIYRLNGEAIQTLDLGLPITDLGIDQSTGNVVALQTDGTVRIISHATGGTIARYSVGSPVGHQGQVSVNANYIAVSGCTMAGGVRVIERSNNNVLLANIGTNAPSVLLVGAWAYAGIPSSDASGTPNRVQVYDIETRTIKTPVDTAEFPVDLASAGNGGVIYASRSEGFKYALGGPVPGPNPNPNPNPTPTPTPVDKGMSGTINVVLGPAGPDGKRALVSAAGFFENVK